MHDHLAGITAKIDRAEEHIRDFQSEWIDFGRRAYEVFAEDDGERRYFRLRIREDMPLRLSTILGDAVTNLRTALDYLIFELLCVARQPVSKHHYFPIGNSFDHFKATFPSKVKGIGNEAEKIVCALKPYKGGTDGFWNLNEISIADKHRLLVTVTTRGDSLGLNLADVFGSMNMPWLSEEKHAEMLTSIRNNYIVIRGQKSPCPVLKDGDVISSAPLTPQPHDNTTFGFVIAFGEGEVLECEAVTPVLRDLSSLVKATAEPFRPLLS